MIFDWDENKNVENIKNHDGISFEEAQEVFFDEFRFEEFDKKHSTANEKRFTVIGLSFNGILFVVYTVRNQDSENEIYRIISARFAEPEEKILYEQEKYRSGYFG